MLFIATIGNTMRFIILGGFRKGNRHHKVLESFQESVHVDLPTCLHLHFTTIVP